MKKIYIALCLAVAAFTSCRSLVEEWQPVFTFGSPQSDATFKLYSEADLASLGFGGTFTTIGELKALYKSGGV